MLEALVGVPLFVLPGFFLTRAAWPIEGVFASERVARGTLAVTFSVANAILGGLVLAWTVGLTPTFVWAWFGASAVGAGGIAWARGGLPTLGPAAKT